jgi:hypothetical protein
VCICTSCVWGGVISSVYLCYHTHKRTLSLTRTHTHTHTGQFPDTFKAAVCRNPVADLTLMIGTTDIPDWWVKCSVVVYNTV